MKAVEDSKAEVNMVSTVAPDAASCPLHSQRRGKMSNLLLPTILLFANPRVAITLWDCFWQASLLCGCDAFIPIALTAPSLPAPLGLPVYLCRVFHLR